MQDLMSKSSDSARAVAVPATPTQDLDIATPTTITLLSIISLGLISVVDSIIIGIIVVLSIILGLILIIR